MLDAKAVDRIVRQAQEAGLLFPTPDADAQEARLRVWQSALNADGLGEAEAFAAVVSVAKYTGEDRIAYGRCQPGNLIEAAMVARRRAIAAPTVRRSGAECPECESGPAARGDVVKRGWVMTEIEAHGARYPATRRCSSCSGSAVA